MYDIVFISYGEPNAEANWESLKKNYPLAKRVKDVKGIHQAHIAAAKKAFTKMFWVVDGDAELLLKFNFDYEVSEYDLDVVHVWHSRNPINNLEYGYGGVKLLPRKLTLEMDITKLDMATSISTKFKVMPEVSNITAFNTDPFSTWKSAFRECVKLSSKIIVGQNDEETSKRLDVWCTEGKEQPFGEFAIQGAIQGKEFGLCYKDDSSMLSKINDWKWLEKKFKDI